MTCLMQRRQIIALVADTTQAGARQERACAVICLSERTLQRWQHDMLRADQRPARVQTPPNRLSEPERQTVLAVANSPEFGHLAPSQIVPRLADRGEYIASESTFYRVLRAARQPLIHPVATPYGGNLTGLSSNISGVCVSETGFEVQINSSYDVLFDFDKATLSSKAVNALTHAAEIIRERAKGRVVIEGHADGKGEANYNLRLSQQRAKAVMRWLSNKSGLASGNLSALGYGMQRPVAPNFNPDGSDNPEGRQRNRRVEIKFPKSS